MDNPKNGVRRVVGTEMTRRQFLKSGALAGLGLASSSLLNACGLGNQALESEALAPTPTGAAALTPAVIAAEQVLRIGLTGDPSNLNPLQAGLSTVSPLYEAVFDNLTRIDLETAAVVPHLATEWSVSDDHLTWTFKLREGVVFHNGEEFDAESVRFTVHKAIELLSSPGRRLSADTTAEVIDKYTVAIKTPEPYVLLPAVMADMQMYPAGYYTDVGDEGMARAPVGTGRYKFVEQVTGGPVTLERYDNYWGGRPTLDRLIFTGMPEDTTRVAALEAGEIDMCINLPPDDATRLEGDDRFRISWVPLAQSMNLLLIGRQDDRMKDVRIRQAFNYGVDKELLVQQVMLGYSRPLEGQLVGSDAFGYNPNLEPYPYDPDRARELLAEAGYPDGFSIKFQSSQGRYSKQKEVSEAMVGELAKIGIDLELELLEWGEYVNLLLTEKTSAPVAYVGWNYYPSMDADFVIQHYTGASQYEFFDDPTLNDLYAQSKSEFDPEKRRSILQEWNAAARDLAPVLFLFQSPQIFGLSSRVQGFEATPDHAVHLENVTVQG